MYTFSIERGHVPLVQIVVASDIIETDVYLKSLIKKCFERVFQMIKDKDVDKKEDSSEEADLEEDD